MLKSKLNNTYFFLFIYFACFFYVIAVFYGVTPDFRLSTPSIILISRDILFFILLLLLFLSANNKYLLDSVLNKNFYGKFLKFYYFWLFANIFYGFIYLFIKNPVDILHHHFRNILYYSLFIPFIPLIFKTKKDIYKLIKTIINISIIISIIGIITRIFPGLYFFTWSGRIISTFADPNNLAIFLILPILFLFVDNERRIFIKGMLFVLFFLAFVLCNSMTSFLVLCFSSFVFFLRQYVLKKFFLWLLIPLSILLFSFGVKFFSLKNIRATFTNYYDSDRYMSDKIVNIFYHKFLHNDFNPLSCKIYITSKTRTLTNREEQIKKFAGQNQYLLFGNIEEKAYKKHDNQYFNFIYNFGIFMAIINLSFFVYSIFCGFKKANNELSNISVVFASFLVGVVFFGFNGLALQNRFPLNFLFYLSMSVIFIIPDLKE